MMFMFINAAHTYFHEAIHADICNNFEGTSSISYSFAMQGGKTICTTTEGAMYHTINDIVSYTASILILTTFMCLIYLTALFEKKEVLGKKIEKKPNLLGFRKRS